MPRVPGSGRREDEAEQGIGRIGDERDAARFTYRAPDSSRVRGADATADSRFERVRRFDEQEPAARQALDAYREVIANSVDDSGQGELVGIDILV